MAAADQSLYQQLAERIAQAIRSGTLARGERVPSVREQARREGVSLSTVVQAYRWLEDSRLIEARPRSGYFVVARTPRLPEPEPALLPATSQAVDVSQLAEEVIRCASDPAFVSFGAACPNGDLFMPDRVRRAVTRTAQRHRDSLVRYPLGPGNETLRRAIARHALPARRPRHPRHQRLPRIDQPVPARGDEAGRCRRARIAFLFRLPADP
jgi:DNA-binding transcriptional MocR family regulator